MAPSHSSQPPIMDLSIDIIREIFLQCTSQFPCHIPPKLADPRVVLTHVCSAWREAALATPELWADILIRVNEWPWSNNVYAAGMPQTSPSDVFLPHKRHKFAPLESALEAALVPRFGRHAISPIFCLDILRECTSLSDCAFIIAPADDLIVEDLIILSERPIYLPTLHTLRLTFQNLDHHSTFLNTLHLPNLDLFRLTGQWVDSFKWSPSTLRSFDRLDKLDLRTIQGITGDELYNYLSPLRGLTMLQLPLMGIPLVPSSTAFQGLASGTIGPRVTRIAFGLMTFESLITMVGGRLSVSLATGGEVSAFTVVGVHCPAPIDPGGIARVAALSTAGVEISFMMGFMEQMP
ncbi:hypothetical protein BD779DRAFT_1475784 [Infundibulicybe gibba]|nr:hypothetical protein BD779DRAFT_1475784 [Infundibulicybe gibba]